MNGAAERIELTSNTVAAGENIAVRVLPDPSAPDAGGALELLWRTSGLCKTEERVVVSHTLTPCGPQETSFQLTIPAAGPISYAGKTFSIAWFVRIASAAPAERVFTVVPATRRQQVP